MNRWPHQTYALDQLDAAIEAGQRRICVTSPTGGGKSVIMADAIELAAHKRWPVALYTHRKMLLDQTKKVLIAHGIQPGIRASGHPPALLKDVQLCMTQTERNAVYGKKTRELHPAKLVLIDEAHVQTADTMEQILNDHVAFGATVVGITATPLDIGHLYEHLIVAGNNTELRACGALVPCHTYAPDEPDLKHVKKYKVGEDLSDADNAKAIMREGVFGRVLDNMKIINPEGRPTILFAPGVAESIWFAEQFKAAGISAAHIDGTNVWIDGELQKTSDPLREEIAEGSRSGQIQVVCNRFVMREGINWPWLSHGIFATVFGSLTSFLQSGGRLLRADASLDHVTLQDHGGNWWRHGSLNADREWEMTRTNHEAVGLRMEAMRSKKEAEPITCPRCHALRLSGDTCHKCDYRHTTKSRMVVQVDGTLKQKEGDVLRPRRVKMESNTSQLWREMFHRARSKKWNASFNQAEAFFFREYGYYPPRNLALMPTNDIDWFRKVADVPRDRLRGEVQHA